MAKKGPVFWKGAAGGIFFTCMCFLWVFFSIDTDKLLFQKVDPSFMASILSFLRIKIRWVSIKELQFLNKHLRLLWWTVILVDYKLLYNNNLYFMVNQMLSQTYIIIWSLQLIVFAHYFLKHFTFLLLRRMRVTKETFCCSSPMLFTSD